MDNNCIENPEEFVNSEGETVSKENVYFRRDGKPYYLDIRYDDGNEIRREMTKIPLENI